LATTAGRRRGSRKPRRRLALAAGGVHGDRLGAKNGGGESRTAESRWRSRTAEDAGIAAASRRELAGAMLRRAQRRGPLGQRPRTGRAEQTNLAHTPRAHIDIGRAAGRMRARRKSDAHAQTDGPRGQQTTFAVWPRASERTTPPNPPGRSQLSGALRTSNSSELESPVAQQQHQHHLSR
jgi:hypothetical protein